MKSPLYTLLDDLLYHMNPKQQNLLQLVIPEHLIGELLDTMHSGLFAGHFGVRKTFDKINHYYYWDSMVQDIKDYCSACSPCQQKKSPSHPTRTPLVPLPTVERSWDRVATHILGPINPPSQTGHKYIRIFTDYLTHWVEAFPLRDIKAETVAKVFVEAIVCRYSAPKQLLTDHGTKLLHCFVVEIITLKLLAMQYLIDSTMYCNINLFLY